MLYELREDVWKESAEATKLTYTQAIELTPDAGIPAGAAASPGGMVGGPVADAAMHETRTASPMPVGAGVARDGGAATRGDRGGVGGGYVGGLTLMAPLCPGHQEGLKTAHYHAGGV